MTQSIDEKNHTSLINQYNLIENVKLNYGNRNQEISMDEYRIIYTIELEKKLSDINRIILLIIIAIILPISYFLAQNLLILVSAYVVVCILGLICKNKITTKMKEEDLKKINKVIFRKLDGLIEEDILNFQKTDIFSENNNTPLSQYNKYSYLINVKNVRSEKFNTIDVNLKEIYLDIKQAYLFKSTILSYKTVKKMLTFYLITNLENGFKETHNFRVILDKKNQEDIFSVMIEDSESLANDPKLLQDIRNIMYEIMFRSIQNNVDSIGVVDIGNDMKFPSLRKHKKVNELKGYTGDNISLDNDVEYKFDGYKFELKQIESLSLILREIKLLKKMEMNPTANLKINKRRKV